MKVTDIAKVIAPNVEHKIIGILPGEKLHEQMISSEDSYSTYEYDEHFKILPQINNWGKDKERIKNGIKVPQGFVYASDTNSEWMTKENLQTWIDENQNYIGKL
jgi:FlaA1/EpsC-like NDP-sugar epimerase